MRPLKAGLSLAFALCASAVLSAGPIYGTIVADGNPLKDTDVEPPPQLRRIPAVLIFLVLALGANDGLRGVSLASVEQNLATIIQRAQTRGMRVLLCGMEAPPLNGWNCTIGFHEIFPRLAHQYSVSLVPFLLEGVALVREMNGPDGIHPNAAGATRIADTIWPYLERMLEAGRIAA